MQMIGDAFNMILFVTVIGGAFTILSLLISRVLQVTVPLWFCICQMAAYIVPLLAPGLYLIPPEEHSWRQGYYIACLVWVCGILVLTVCDVVRMAFAHRAIRNYKICQDKQVNELCSRCVQLVGTVKIPSVCFGTLLLWGRIFDYICILNWFNPFVWIAKEEFAVSCEWDCDRSAVTSLWQKNALP